MRLLCDSCGRTLPPAGFRVEGAALVLVCAGCGVEARSEPRAATSAEAGSEASAGAALPATGPSASFVAAKGPRLAAASAAGAGANWMEVRWTAVQASWADPLAHDRLITEAVARDALPELGRRYAEHLARSPGDAAARRARDELVRRAAAHLFTQLPAQEKSFGPREARKVQIALIVLIALATVIFGVVVLRGIQR